MDTLCQSMPRILIAMNARYKVNLIHMEHFFCPRIVQAMGSRDYHVWSHQNARAMKPPSMCGNIDLPDGVPRRATLLYGLSVVGSDSPGVRWISW